MAGDWIAVQTALFDHPRVVALASQLGHSLVTTLSQNVVTTSSQLGHNLVTDESRFVVSKYVVIGAVLRTWSLFDAFSTDGTLRGYGAKELDLIVGIPGWAAAMEAVGWLEVGTQTLRMPEFTKWLGKSAKARLDGMARKRRSRSTQDSASEFGHESVTTFCDKSVTREEKRREDINTLTTTDVVVSTVPCSTAPVVVADGSYLTAGGKEVQIEQRHVDRWVKTYGDRVDVIHELAKAQAWLVANPQKRPRNTNGVVKFLTNWLNRTDERERRDARASPAVSPPAASRVISPLEALGPKHGASNGPRRF